MASRPWAAFHQGAVLLQVAFRAVMGDIIQRNSTVASNILLRILGTPFALKDKLHFVLTSKGCKNDVLRKTIKPRACFDVTQPAMAVPTLPVTNGVSYKVKLGKSFSDRNNNAFHTISCKVSTFLYLNNLVHRYR